MFGTTGGIDITVSGLSVALDCQLVTTRSHVITVFG
jgi:hypothetical protein